MPRLEHLWFGGAAALLVGGVGVAGAMRAAGHEEWVGPSLWVAGVGFALSFVPLALVLVMNAASRRDSPAEPPSEDDGQS